MSEEFIDYSSLVDQAMHIIVKKSLEIVATKSFYGDHHFFISFLTSFPGVELSSKLRKKYPQEMTIVLQYQFENLKVSDDHFSVTLSFDNIKESISIPYKSLTAFADPSVKFGLQFRHYEDLLDENDVDIEEEEILKSHYEQAEQKPEKKKAVKKESGKPKQSSSDSNVIALDSFRKK